MAAPKKSQQLRNKLKRIHKLAIETRLNFLEELSENIPDIYKAMIRKAKGKEPATGNYKAQKDLFDTWLSFTKNTDEAIKWLEKNLDEKEDSGSVTGDEGEVIGLSLVR